VITAFALQTLNLKRGAAPSDLETRFEVEILPASADMPGSVDRGGDQLSLASIYSN
jgi:hypothetical protein